MTGDWRLMLQWLLIVLAVVAVCVGIFHLSTRNAVSPVEPVQVPTAVGCDCEPGWPQNPPTPRGR